MKKYLYHQVPERMIGSTLFPLNSLREVDMETYQLAQNKYIAKRQKLMELYNPTLDCLWNDVIFLIAVPPQEINHAIDEAGLKNPYTGISYYKIDLDSLDSSLLGIYWERADVRHPDYYNFSPFNKNLFGLYKTLPNDVHLYFKAIATQPLGKQFYFPLQYVPLLYKGPIDISSAEIITV